MNIQEAKQQIKHAMIAYFSKDSFGNYEIPPARQRPIFLVGAPGIGKTAIMEQIAQELGVGLVSYSMTHHTRQSALGLPFITDKTYGGESCRVSEYTMSEIIGSVYDEIEQTGVKEGILFLDEINCVSETLAPSMLQFLQLKTFGRHAMPSGWLVVTAGNPPQYNRSVRTFDVVTLDRLRKIEVEPDLGAWRRYASEQNLHPAVLSYLDIRKDHFYSIETTPDGKRFVTARGWEDLAKTIALYEKHELPVDEKLIVQYLQDPRIAKDFSVYYDLFKRYRSDYQIERILSGEAPDEIRDRAAKAKFDERIALLSLLLECITQEMQAQMENEEALSAYLALLKSLRTAASNPVTLPMLEQTVARQRQRAASLAQGQRAGQSALRKEQRVLAMLETSRMNAEGACEQDDLFPRLREHTGEMISQASVQASAVQKRLEAVFSFCESVFSGGQELLILVTELTIHPAASRFISRHGSDGYYRNNKELLFYERQKDILAQLDELTMPD